MAGSTDKFASNIELPLSSAPQGKYDPVAQADMEDHFNSTQTLSNLISEAFTTRILFLVAVPAGKFISVDVSVGEAIGILAAGGVNVVIGFLKEAVAPGEYGVVWSCGYNTNMSGLTPGVKYKAIAGGDVAPYVPSTNQCYVGFAITPTTLVVQNMGIGLG